jgi:hypothetical protein
MHLRFFPLRRTIQRASGGPAFPRSPRIDRSAQPFTRVERHSRVTSEGELYCRPRFRNGLCYFYSLLGIGLNAISDIAIPDNAIPDRDRLHPQGPIPALPTDNANGMRGHYGEDHRSRGRWRDKNRCGRGERRWNNPQSV